MYKFISSKSIISQLKHSKHFKTDLGRAFINSGANNELKADLSRQEEFVKFYYKKYNEYLHKEGNIGQIEFYSDMKIKKDIVIYYDKYDFVFLHSPTIMRDKGIEKYLGFMIKEIETKHLPKIINKQTLDDQEAVLSEEDKMLLAEQKIKNNPGMVTYDDIKYLIKNRKQF